MTFILVDFIMFVMLMFFYLVMWVYRKERIGLYKLIKNILVRNYFLIGMK